MTDRSQLNVYVPREARPLLDRLRRLSKRTGKPLNALVVEALGEYIERRDRHTASFQAFDLGVRGTLRRSELYDERLDRKTG